MLHRRAGIVLAFGVAGALTLAGLDLLHRGDSQRVLYTVSLPLTAYGVALDTRTGRAFVSGAGVAAGTGSVGVYDLHPGRLLRALGPFSPNVEVTVIAALQRAFVTDSSGLVTMLDARDGRTLRTMAAGGNPTFVAVDLRHGWLDLSNPDADTIDVLDARTGRDVRRISLAPFAAPTGIWLDERTGNVVSANVGTKTVSVVDTVRGVVLQTVATDPYPWVTGDGRGHLFATTPRGLLMLDAAGGRALRTIRVLAALGGVNTMTVDERNSHLFITGAQKASMVDTRTGRLLWTIPLHDAVLGGHVVGLDDRRDRVYLWDVGGVKVLDGQTGLPLRTMSLGRPADIVAISPRRQRVLVAATGPPGKTSGPARLLDVSNGAVLWAQQVGMGSVSLTVDDQAGYAFIFTAGGTATSPDPLQWLPRWVRRLPFLPAPAQRTIPPQMTVLDLSR